jgi:suppressor of G2 allele of SKP1
MPSWDTRLRAAADAADSAATAVEESEYSRAVSLYSSAASTLEQALHDVLIGCASAAVSADNATEAIVAAQRATRFCPASGLAWYWLGYANIKAGDRTVAKRAFQKAMDVENDLTLKASYMDWMKRVDAGDESIATADTTKPPPSMLDVDNVGHVPPGAGIALANKGCMDIAQAVQPASDIRMEWYQSTTFVTIDVYAKNVDKAASSVDITESRLLARLVRPGKDDYVLERDLNGPVVPEESSWSASKFKAEIRLKKVSGSGEWKSLAATGLDQSAAERARLSGEKKASAVFRSQKNWDAIADKELEGEKDEDGPMSIFKTIYAGADEDARRAMMKSYTESGGKVLSTDWSDVKQRKVEYKEDADRT